MVPVLTLLLFFSHTALLTNGFNSFRQLQLPSTGSEAYAFDPDHGGPYTALNDGRIVKFEPEKNAFVEFATTTSNRSRELCDGTNGSNVRTCMTCGRPLALEFNHRSGELYIIDAYYGLMVVGRNGGVATPLTGGRNGRHFDFAYAIDIDPITGVVYVTDLGDILSRTDNITDILLSNYRGGSLVKYDPRTRRCDVVLKGLAIPAGVAVSRDGSFLLVTEYLTSSIKRLWLKGPKANTSEKFAELPGNPDNIKRTRSGDFWVAMNIQRIHPKLTVFPLGQKISATGRILKTVNFFGEYNETRVAEVQEFRDAYYVSSQNTNFVGVYERLGCLEYIVSSFDFGIFLV